MEELAKLPSLASDRAPADGLFIPSARSSSGVVSAAPEDAGAWVPPALVPAAAEPRPTSAPTAEAYVLEFDDGTRVAASASGLLGRNPAAAPGEPQAQLLPLADDSMRISKTHAAFGIDATGFWVADRSSRNGTMVHRPDGDAHRLPPGVRTPVPAGSRVTLGGRSFVVVAGGIA